MDTSVALSLRKGKTTRKQKLADSLQSFIGRWRVPYLTLPYLTFTSSTCKPPRSLGTRLSVVIHSGDYFTFTQGVLRSLLPFCSLLD